MKWSENEIKILIKNFNNKTNEELSLLLNRSMKSIMLKAYRLKLKKSKKHKSKMIAKRNKIVGRDLSIENLRKIAKQYKTRGQFQIFDSSAYATAIRTKYMNEICEHMIKSTSIPQLILTYIIENILNSKLNINDRKIIKPYELDIYIPEYKLAFEYDGLRWHKNNKNDIIKNKLCKEKNIFLIRIKEKSRKYIDDIKTQLINNINNINIKTNLKINKNDILNIKDNDINNYINSQILDINEIKNIISKYKTYESFKKNEKKIYNKLNKTKTLYLLNDLKRKRIYWTEEQLKKEISKYDYLIDFIKQSQKCYLYIKRHKLEKLISSLKRIK